MLLRMKGIYQITMDTEMKPNSVTRKTNYLNRMDEAININFYSISQYILYHVESKNTPIEFWTMLSTLFGAQDEMRGHQLEVELMNMRPSDFDSIKEYFIKFK